MKSFGTYIGAAAILCCISSGLAQQKPAYLDTSLPPEQRAADLVQRMTLEEKASQMVNGARAIPRLDIPAYNWWSEALHGVIDSGVTEFPEPIGLAASFDVPGVHAMATDIGIEGRIKHVQDVAAGHTGIMGGLDFWAPNLNLFRDPRWGRGQETYGEDPYLIGRMGVAFVNGMQGDDPKYYRVIATPKHFVVHSGPEPTRHFSDVDVTKHDELDAYEPGFRAAVVEGKAGSVMCAYNAINGQPACADDFLLQNQLREKWNFQGYVVSDCGAVRDVFSGHHYRPTLPQAVAISVMRGMDNECFGSSRNIGDYDYKPYIEAVQQGYLPESAMDTALVRLFSARIKLGMFDPPDMVPYTKIDEKELSSPEHRDLARKLADESLVLLKNDGTLPLRTSGIRIAVIGPLASQTRVLLGNYNGRPTHTVSILEGLRKEFAGATIQYEPGTQFMSREADPVPAGTLTFDGKPGIKATYSKLDMSDINHPEAMKALAQRTEPAINASAQPLPAEVATVRPLSIRWEGEITATETGDYNLGLKANGFFRLQLNGKGVASGFGSNADEAALGRVHLEAGKPAALRVQYSPPVDEMPNATLVWSKLDLKPQPEALAAARGADVVIAVLGITSELEGEERQVSEPGFFGGDRTSIDLPQPEEDLLEALVATGKPVVLVLTNGSALAVNWAKDHVNAILDAWYPGEEGGTAVAETLSGKNNPAGRLPVTFYTGVEQLPSFEDYSMKNRTYRYFEGTPLYPFGYGLSYTTFSYSGISLPTSPVAAGQPMSAEVTVTNTGSRAGDEVAQLYLSFPDVDGAPIRALRAFQRLHLDPGQSKKIHFDLQPRDLSMVTAVGEIVIPEGKYSVSIGGGQPNTGAPTVEGTFQMEGSVILPE